MFYVTYYDRHSAKCERSYAIGGQEALDKDKNDMSKIVEVKADGDELVAIEDQIEVIPKAPKRRVVQWDKPWVNFIVSNINLNIEEQGID